MILVFSALVLLETYYILMYDPEFLLCFVSRSRSLGCHLIQRRSPNSVYPRTK